MILSLTDLKLLLGITDSSKDSLLSLQIDLVEDLVFNFLKNYFESDYISYESNTISFSTVYISDSNSKFIEKGFVNGIYRIQNSIYNNRFVTVSTVASDRLTITDALTTETASNYIKLSMCNVPKDIKLCISNMIGFNLANKFGVKSESFSRYSVSYGSENGQYISGFPNSITQVLLKYRRIYDV